MFDVQRETKGREQHGVAVDIEKKVNVVRQKEKLNVVYTHPDVNSFWGILL